MQPTNHSPVCELSKECHSADDHDVCPGDVIDDYLEFCIHCAVDCTCRTQIDPGNDYSLSGLSLGFKLPDLMHDTIKGAL
jgi:hypothetical protein